MGKKLSPFEQRESAVRRAMTKFTANPDTGCWDWDGTVSSAGYGVISIGSHKALLAHRLMWEVHRWPIAADLEIDHLCRNRRCCNPEHLEPVPHRINTRRGEAITSKNASKTNCPVGHPYAGDNLYIGKGGRRVCRACCRERWMRYYHRKLKPERLEKHGITGGPAKLAKRRFARNMEDGRVPPL